MEDIIKVGIIGLGRSGRDIHGNTLFNHPKYKISAVSDSVDARLSKAKEDWGCCVYKDYRELIKDKDIALIIVATPSSTHFQIATDGLKAGKKVVVEKPMAISVEEADKMIDISKKSGCMLTVFQNLRFAPDFLNIQEIISSGILGQIYFIRRGSYDFGRRTDWQAVEKYGGGMLNNWGSHILDQVLILLDYKVKEVFSDVRITVSAGDAEDNVKIVIKGENVVADIDIMSCCAYPQANWLIMGKYGTAMINNEGFKYKYYDPNDLKPLPRIEEISAFSDYSYPSEEIPWKEKVVEIKSSESMHTKFYNALYDTIRNGKSLAVKPEQVRMILEIIDKCKKNKNQNP